MQYQKSIFFYTKESLSEEQRLEKAMRHVKNEQPNGCSFKANHMDSCSECERIKQSDRKATTFIWGKKVRSSCMQSAADR